MLACLSLPLPHYNINNLLSYRGVRSYPDISTPRLWQIQQRERKSMHISFNSSHHEQIPFLKWWNRFTSLTTISLLTIFVMNLVASWQFPHTLRFFMISNLVANLVFKRPKAIASLTLWLHNIFSLTSSSRECNTNSVFGKYPIALISWSNLSKSCIIFSYWKWLLSFRRKAWSFPFILLHCTLALSSSLSFF